MKRIYFGQPSADDDDAALGVAKIMGYVPTTCLLGGAHVWEALDAGRDPCSGCLGPREKCLGREMMVEETPTLDQEPFDLLSYLRDRLRKY